MGSDVLGQIGADLSGYLEVAANYAIDLLPLIIVSDRNYNSSDSSSWAVNANLIKGLFPGRKVVVLFDLAAGEIDAATARTLYEQVITLLFFVLFPLTNAVVALGVDGPVRFGSQGHRRRPQ